MTRAEWSQMHAGHRVHTFPVSGRRRCLTCHASYALDHVAVQRAIAGDPPAGLTTAERRAAILALDARGLTADAIAARVRCCARTVVRIRTGAWQLA